jgi:2-methylcitrate dehydratase PrpD
MALCNVETADVGNFSDEMAHDPKLMALRQKVDVVADDELSETQAKVVLTLLDGRVISVAHDLNMPMPLDQRQTRLRAKAETLLGPKKADALWTAVNGGDTIALFD